MALCWLNVLRTFSELTDMNVSGLRATTPVRYRAALTAPTQESAPFELVFGGRQFRWKAHAATQTRRGVSDPRPNPGCAHHRGA